MACNQIKEIGDQMKRIGRKIFYEVATGNVLVDTGERRGFVKETTVEQDVMAYKELYSRVRDSFSVIELPFGAYAQDFTECDGYRINIETNQLEFSYPGLNNPEEPTEPVYQKSLGEEVEDLKTENELLKASVLEMTTYAAEQDSRLVTQEQAMLELTTLIAGGNV